MSGFVLAYGTCISCRAPFSFNPHKVPSLRVNGVREPICGSCMQAANIKRKEAGLAPHAIDPEAYQALPEGEL